MERLGVKLDFERVDRVRAVIDPVQPFHRGGIGTAAVNGAVLAGLFDLAIGTVGWLSRPNTRSATVSLAMTFLRPTRGDRIVVEAWLLRAGVNLTFAAAEIRDASDEVTARCDGTVAVARGGADETEYTRRMRPRADAAPSVSAPRASRRPAGSSPRKPRSPGRSSRSRG